MKKTISEFKAYVAEMKILSLATAFIVGAASNDLIKSLVNNIFMPIVGIFVPNGSWEEATWTIGSAKIAWGPFLSTSLQFLIILLALFIITKKLIKSESEKS